MPAGVTPAGFCSDLEMFLLVPTNKGRRTARIDYFFLRVFSVNIAKFWKRFRTSKQRSSRVDRVRQDRPRLAVEVLEGRALPSATFPTPTVETGAALHLSGGFTAVDDVVVDGQVITANNSDVEWKYVTVRRTLSSTGIDYRHTDLYLNIWINQAQSGGQDLLVGGEGDRVGVYGGTGMDVLIGNTGGDRTT